MSRNEARPIPKSVCLETYSLCNGKCVFCPYSHAAPNPPVQMDTQTVHRIIDEISKLPVERFSLFNNNEPLLDPRMQEFIRYAREQLTSVRLTLSSNGKRVTSQEIDEAISNGIDRFFISIPTLDPEAYRKIMGGDVSNVVSTVLGVSEEHRSNLRIAVPNTTYYSCEDYDRVFRSNGIRAIVWEMEAIHSWQEVNQIREISRIGFGIGCDRPLDQAIISSNGDVLICCRDWYHENCVGNVHEASLAEIWQGQRMRELQRLVAAKHFDQIVMCSKCSRVVSCFST